MQAEKAIILTWRSLSVFLQVWLASFQRMIKTEACCENIEGHQVEFACSFGKQVGTNS